MPDITIDGFEEVAVGGQRLDPGGPYTFVISERPELKDFDPSRDMETDSDYKPYLEIRFKVIDGPEQEEPNSSGGTNPAGMIHVQRFYLKARWGIKRLLIATGILSRDDTESPVAKGKFNTDMLYNCKLQGIVKAEMYNNREYRNVEPII